MKLLYVMVFCLMSIQAIAQSDQIILGQVPTGQICVGSFIEFPVALQGNIPTSASFTVELGNRYSSLIFNELPASYSNGKIRFQFAMPQNTDEHILSSPMYIRVKCQAPTVRSEWSDRFFYGAYPPKVTLTSRSYQANPESLILLDFSYSGTTPITGLLKDQLSNDSLRIPITSFVDLSGQVSVLVQVDKNREYVLTSVENRCGSVPATGTITIKTNPFLVRTTSVSSREACMGMKASVNVSTQGGSLSSGSTFKVRLTETLHYYEDGEYINSPLDVPATYENGAIHFTVPAIPTDEPRQYTVRIIQENPYLVSSSENVFIRIHPKPTARITSQDHTITYGEKAAIHFSLNGPTPLSVVLNDQSSYRSDGYVWRFNHPKPKESTTYSIQNFTTSCGVGVADQKSVRVTVLPGMILEPVPTKIFCEGETISLPFLSNISLPEKVDIRLRFDKSILSEVAEATITQQTIRFKIPNATLPAGQGPRLFSLVINTGNQIFETGQKIKVAGKPAASIPEPMREIQASELKDYPVSIAVSGGGPYTVQLTNGRKFYVEDFYDPSQSAALGLITVKPYEKSTTYTLEKISNTCGVTDLRSSGNQSFTITLTKGEAPEQSIQLQMPPAPYCVGDSLPVTFQTKGKFADDNEFILQKISVENQVTDTLTIKSPNAGTVLIPIGKEQQYKIRMVSTNPATQSETHIIKTYRKPSVSLTANSLYQERLLLGDSVALMFRETNHPNNPLDEIIVTNGKQDWDFSYRPTSQSGFFASTFYPKESGTYQIKSVSNVCGAGTATGVITLDVNPYRISIPDSYRMANLVLCATSTYQFPYLIAGKIPSTIPIVLEIASAKDMTYDELLTSVTTNPVSFQIPENLPDGSYLLRLRAGTESSLPVSFTLSGTPTATLFVEDSTQVDAGQPKELKINFTGAGPWNVTMDGTVHTVSTNPGSLIIRPTQSKIYRLTRVTNACGYGTVAGDVKVAIRPEISMMPTTFDICNGSSLSVDYSLSGEFEPSNKIIVGLYTLQNKFIPLDSVKTTTSGSISVKMPANLSSTEFYQLKVMSTAPALSHSCNVYLTTPPSYQLFGSTTIMAGTSTTLKLVSQNIPSNRQSDITYELSTGEKGKFIYDNSEQTITVTPFQTTHYKVSSISNGCGKGVVTGSATITVNPASERSIDVRIMQAKSTSGFICKEDTVVVTYETKGTFSAENRMTVQLSDSLGENFTTLPTLAGSNPKELKAVLPKQLNKGYGYRIRVVASDANVTSNSYPQVFTSAEKATVKFGIAQLPPYTKGSNYKIPLEFTGDRPVYMYWSVQSTEKSFYTHQVRDTLRLETLSPNATYRINRVYNSCGLGTVLTPSSLTVELITAADPAQAQEVNVYPNPTTERIRITFKKASAYRVQLYTVQGRIVTDVPVNDTAYELDLNELPGGVYLLRVSEKKQMQTFRIVKN